VVRSLVVALLLAGCTSSATPSDAGAGRDAPSIDSGPPPSGELSTVLTPRRPPEHYVQQANIYFDTLDTRADPEIVPDYSIRVARWEWPPWWKLTGYERDQMISSTRSALFFEPSTVPERDCRAFDVQPFARCHVVFSYEGGTCPIYEEFTFNDAGEMTFIEAWSDLPGLGPTEDPGDHWAEGPGVHRLSTRIPGLGNETGLIDPTGPWMTEAAARDPEVADFAMRTQDFWRWWREALTESGPDAFARGCGW
jgi:hypothetical protein